MRTSVAYGVHSSPPIIQRTMRLTSTKSALYCTTSAAADANIDTVTPARISVAGGSVVPTRPICQTTATAASAPTTAAALTPAVPATCVTPSRIASTAASDAPDDTPSVNGSASGFRSTAWNAQPAPASAAPHSSAATTRRSRTSNTSPFVSSLQIASSGSTATPPPGPPLPTSGASTVTSAHTTPQPTRIAVNRRASSRLPPPTKLTGTGSWIETSRDH